MTEALISAIVPTVGRPDSLGNLLQSLADQSRVPDEVIIADASDGDAVDRLLVESRWRQAGLVLRHLHVRPPNAVRQRRQAIAAAVGDWLLLLDDDVVLESRCLEHLCSLLGHDPGVVAVCADFNNQDWSQPSRAWQLYLRLFHRLGAGQWQGRVLGPLLRFGYHPAPAVPVPMDWLGTGNSLIRRQAFERVGGFSDFFLYRCTSNEDVDLGIKMHREGEILLCPAARLGHFHDPAGRLAPVLAAEDDLYNRYMVLWRTAGCTRSRALGLVLVYFLIESGSNVLGALRRLEPGACWPGFLGRLRALARIAAALVKRS